jgi:hypothetical protein
MQIYYLHIKCKYTIVTFLHYERNGLMLFEGRLWAVKEAYCQS